MKRTAILTTGILGLAMCASVSGEQANLPSHTIYHGGNIITMEGDSAEYAEAVVEKAGRIVYVGEKAGALAKFDGEAKAVDLEGKTLMPGFIEPHLHPSIAAVMLPNDTIAPHDWNKPDGIARAAKDPEAFKTRLKASIDERARAGEMHFVWGYHPLWHGPLGREMLNQLAPDKPVGVIHRSFHEIYLNDAAIDLFKLDQADYADNPQVDWERGHFFEGGWLALVPKIGPFLLNPETYKQGLSMMTRLMLRNGITTICEPGFPSADFAMEYGLLKTEMDKNPPYDTYLIPNGTQLYGMSGNSNEKAEQMMRELPQKYDTQNIFFLPGQVKLFADGAIYSLAMEMKASYTSDEFAGEWMTPLDLLQQQQSFYWDRGYKIHVHANGDKGIQQVIDFNREDQKRNPRDDHRFTLHHMGYFDDAIAQQASDLGIEASVNPYYLWALADKYAAVGLGRERAENLVPIKALTSRGVPVSFHSDFAMAPAEPLTLAWTAVNRVTSEGSRFSQDQRLDVFSAMQGITINAARTLNQEREIGSIKAGKVANFTILEHDPFKVEPMTIKDIPVYGVVHRGEMAVNQKQLLGGDRDAHGCIASAGYLWCAKTNKCERPWELAKKEQFENTIEAFDKFCGN
ncbi:amidohydrolase [Mangrovimicrobium sediminis]|uniref:Amidohydrolase n=1 Tax=Mangrovimicrobium sediminis TaxID=2562682 RepID=A0A4Z0M2S1_9GAMM|nr:amidohydrolase family protein [Haliea sp. SAOS-164]TGD73983.1 amidohydrolase [Haliea sp. SAOS-164]